MKDKHGREAIGEGDSTTHGGVLINCSGQYVYPGRHLARAGDMIYCPKCMKYTYIDDGDHFGGKQDFAVAGQSTTCGAVLTPGPPTVKYDESGAARTLTGGASSAPPPQGYVQPATFREPEEPLDEPSGNLRIHLVSSDYYHITDAYPSGVDGSRLDPLAFSLRVGLALGDGGWDYQPAYVNKSMTMYGVPVGPAVLGLTCPEENMHRILEHLPPPRYSWADPRNRNGVSGGPPEPAGLDRMPEENFTVTHRDELGWKSWAEREAERIKARYIRVRYLPSADDPERWEYEINGKRTDKFEVELDVMPDNKQYVTTYVIEVDGRYALVPALQHVADFNNVHAYNCSCFGHLSYGEFDLTEGNVFEGSAQDIFKNLSAYKRVTNINDKTLPLVLLRVPYALRYTVIHVFTDDVTGLRALCAASADSIILSFSGLNRECYAGKEAREREKPWQAAMRALPLPFAGRKLSATEVRAMLPDDDPTLVGNIDRLNAQANHIKLRILPTVHEGVYRAFSGLQEQVYTFLRTNNPGGRKKLYVVGSCMGGAVASLFLADMQPEEGSNPIFYSFGMPRMLSREMVELLETKKIAHFNIGVMGDVLQTAPHTHEWVEMSRVYGGLIAVPATMWTRRYRGLLKIIKGANAREEQDYYTWGRPSRLMYHENEVEPRKEGKFTHPERNNPGPLLRPDSSLAMHFDFVSQFSRFNFDDYPTLFAGAFEVSRARQPFLYAEALAREMLCKFRAVRGDARERLAAREGYMGFLRGMARYMDNEISILNKSIEHSYYEDKNGTRHMYPDARYILSPIRDEYLDLKNELEAYRKYEEAKGDIPVSGLELGLNFTEKLYTAQVRQELKEMAMDKAEDTDA